MNLRPLSLIAGLLLLVACSQNPSTNANTGSGVAVAATTTSSAVPGSEQDFTQNVGDRVFFDFDKSNIRPEGQTTLQRQADWLKKYPNVSVTIEGHCDERGTREYNLAWVCAARRLCATRWWRSTYRPIVSRRSATARNGRPYSVRMKGLGPRIVAA